MVEWMLGVNPTQSYGENTKSSIQDFHRFGYKNLLKLIFLNNFSQLSVIFTHYCLILQYLHYFELKQRKKSWKFFENFSFYQNFQFSGSTTLHISCHNLAELWRRTNNFFTKISLKDPSKSALADIPIWKSQSFGRYLQRYQGGGVKMTSPWVFTLIKRAWYFQG